jgi:serine/threonine-protein kinase
VAATERIRGEAAPTRDPAATVLDPAGSDLDGLQQGAALHGGRFRVVRTLGRGGFGTTYEAHDERLHRRVALKELPPASAKDRIMREARILARFSHPGIVRIFEVFEERQAVYLVMELLEGRTLAEVAAERGTPLSGAEVVDVVSRVGGALQHVHEAGVLHRDVSPANVMLTSDGRLVLIDFGIARPLERTTGPITEVMTPGYAPPEQYRRDAVLSPACDVYALAATAYRLVTGRVPPSAPERLAGVPLDPPWRLNAAVSKEVSDALLDALELDAGHRPRDVPAFLSRLGARSSHSTPTRAEPPPPATRAEIPAPRPAAVAAPLRGDPSAVRGADRLAPGPRPVGPHRRGRRKVLAPVLVACVAFASATPVVVAAVAVLLALPALATLGDAIVHRHRLATGQAWRRWHHWPPGLVLPLRAARNVGLSVLRALPALCFGAVVVAATVLIEHAHGAPLLRDGVVRVGGAVLAVGLVWPAATGGGHFRSGLGIERLVDRFLDDRGRYEVSGWTLLLVCTAVTAAGLWLTPEIWPL